MELNEFIEGYDPDLESSEDPELIYRRIGEIPPEEFHPESEILISVSVVPVVMGLC